LRSHFASRSGAQALADGERGNWKMKIDTEELIFRAKAKSVDFWKSIH
jgi:hypothetical protein